MFWKKKKENKLQFSFIHLNKQFLDVDMEDIVVPVKGNYPDYWKYLRKDKMSQKEMAEFAHLEHRFHNKKASQKDGKFPYLSNKFGRSTTNAMFCPSFLELFNNSFLLKAPCEILIDITPKESRMDVVPIDSKLMYIQRHSLRGQLWGDHNDDLINVKFAANWMIRTTTKPTKLVFLDPTYFNSQPYSVMPGVLPVVPHHEVSLNLNVVFDKRRFGGENYTKIIKKGEVLSLVYMPDGILPFERHDFIGKGRQHFLMDYLKILKQKDYGGNS
jgi:hypothetical protein